MFWEMVLFMVGYVAACFAAWGVAVVVPIVLGELAWRWRHRRD